MITRRGLITGLAAFVAAPAIVRASSLMAVKPVADYLPCDLRPGAVNIWPGRLVMIDSLYDERLGPVVLQREASGLIPRGAAMLWTVD
jgi:hypothetical protein